MVADAARPVTPVGVFHRSSTDDGPLGGTGSPELTREEGRHGHGVHLVPYKEPARRDRPSVRWVDDMNVSEPRGTVPLVVPEMGVEGVAVSLWLVAEGSAVLEGDRVVELVAGAATVDLGAPVTGRLVRQCVDEDGTVVAGAVLAEFEAMP